MRRPRYSGKHPRKPEHRYKELNPEKYQQDIAHIESKGRTVLGTHKPIMLQEILAALHPQEGEIAVDLTLGYGGHTQELLKKITPGGRLLGFDQDPLELPKTQQRIRELGFGEEQFEGILSNFRYLAPELSARAVTQAHIFLADLGLSSMQIDYPERGFTLKFDAPLDFRMNPQRGVPVAEVLRKISVEALSQILREYGDEPFPHKMASAIKAAAEQNALTRTFELKNLILKIVKTISRYPADPDKTVQRVFQALRIHVNQEIESLDELLKQLPQHLASNARVAFLTFHSGEDRLVKQFFQHGLKQNIFQEIHGPIGATADEVYTNRRARSAKLRWGRC